MFSRVHKCKCRAAGGELPELNSNAPQGAMNKEQSWQNEDGDNKEGKSGADG